MRRDVALQTVCKRHMVIGELIVKKNPTCDPVCGDKELNFLPGKHPFICFLTFSRILISIIQYGLKDFKDFFFLSVLSSFYFKQFLSQRSIDPRYWIKNRFILHIRESLE